MAAKKDKVVEAKARGKGTALLVIDIQKGLFLKSTPVYQAERLLANARVLSERARAAGVPVIFMQHADAHSLVKGTDGWQIHPQVQPLPGDVVLGKTRPNSFEEPALEAELEARGVGRVIVMGLVSHGCVKHTCLGARKLGYRVTLVSDGHSSFSKEAEALIAETHAKLSAEGVELTPTAEAQF